MLATNVDIVCDAGAIKDKRMHSSLTFDYLHFSDSPLTASSFAFIKDLLTLNILTKSTVYNTCHLG